MNCINKNNKIFLLYNFKLFVFIIISNFITPVLFATTIPEIATDSVTSIEIENSYTILISFDGLRYDFENFIFQTTRDSTQWKANSDSLSKFDDTTKTSKPAFILKDSLAVTSRKIEFSNFRYITEHGVKASSLKPVFPTTTLPNHYSIMSGMYPVNHGLIVNSFKDPFYNDYFSSNSKGSRKLSKWYLAENFWETARRQNIKTAACYWTCPELEDKLKNPDYLIEFDGKVSYFDRIDDGLELLDKEQVDRPKFLTFYFEEADVQSHLFGTSSQEMASGLVVIDSILGYFFTKLKKINLFDSTNIIIVSDHGMINFDSNNVICIDSILSGIRYELQNYGAFMMIDANKNVLQEIHDSLKLHAVNYDVYFREEMPEHLNFSKHPYISPIIILAKPGWILVDKNSEEKSKKLKAIHGYDNNELAMHGVFYAMGPSFKVNFQTGTIQNIDIYPLLCKIFRIMPRNNIDGKLDRIKFILKDQND